MTKKDDTEHFGGFDLIHSYTRQQAIEDGVLVDVTATAREAGFRYPVALTATVFGAFVEVPPGVSGQDAAGRLWGSGRVVEIGAHFAVPRGSGRLSRIRSEKAGS